MFGYIKMDGHAPRRYRDYFKRNYCFLCRSLDRHYGFFSRLFVSYDVTFFAVLFSEDNYLASVPKISCFRSTKALKDRSKEEFAKKIAALDLTLAAGELKDNINDKDKLYAKIAYFVYGHTFRKVRKDYPLLWEIVEEGHRAMDRVEEENGPIEEIENCFGNLIERIAREVFEVRDEDKISVIKYVAKTLYFMDAADDIDKDIRRGTYNALKTYGSKRNYVLRHYADLKKHSDELRSGLPTLAGKKSLNAGVVSRILDFGIPEMLTKICFKGVRV